MSHEASNSWGDLGQQRLPHVLHVGFGQGNVAQNIRGMDRIRRHRSRLPRHRHGPSPRVSSASRSSECSAPTHDRRAGHGMSKRLKTRAAILGGIIGLIAPVAGAGPANADPPPPSPGGSAQEDPPMPPPPFPFQAWLWPHAFPKCWPPWVPPGEPAPPPGEANAGLFRLQYSPCPAPPPPPVGQAYPVLPPPPPPWPGCGWGDGAICFPGQGPWGLLPPGYYGPLSWYPG